MTLSVEDIRAKLADRSLAKVAEATGISYTTVYNFVNGNNATKAGEIIDKLSEYLED